MGLNPSTPISISSSRQPQHLPINSLRSTYLPLPSSQAKTDISSTTTRGRYGQDLSSVPGLGSNAHSNRACSKPFVLAAHHLPVHRSAWMYMHTLSNYPENTGTDETMAGDTSVSVPCTQLSNNPSPAPFARNICLCRAIDLVHALNTQVITLSSLRYPYLVPHENQYP